MHSDVKSATDGDGLLATCVSQASPSLYLRQDDFILLTFTWAWVCLISSNQAISWGIMELMLQLEWDSFWSQRTNSLSDRAFPDNFLSMNRNEFNKNSDFFIGLFLSGGWYIEMRFYQCTKARLKLIAILLPLPLTAWITSMYYHDLLILL